MTTPHSIERDPNQHQEQPNPDTQSIKSFQNIEIQRNLSNISNYQATESNQNSKGRPTRVTVAHEEYVIPNEATITEGQEPAETPDETQQLIDLDGQDPTSLPTGAQQLTRTEPQSLEASRQRLQSSHKQVQFGHLISQPASSPAELLLTEGTHGSATQAVLNVLPQTGQTS